MFSQFLTAGATGPETHGNAIALARKPVYDSLLRDFPNTLLRASDHFVGLPDGQMGNSEVGHLNLGAGRIVRMDMTRIDTAIADGSFFTDPTLLAAMAVAQAEGAARSTSSACCRMAACIRISAICTRCCVWPRSRRSPRVFVHAFMDGRDTMPNSGLGYLGGAAAAVPRDRHWRAGQRQRTLLRHGPRPALGEGDAGV